MHGEVWVAARDINEPNLKVKAGSPLPDRFQSRYVVKHQLMPYIGEDAFKLTDPQTPVTSTDDRIAALEASNDMLRSRIEELEAGRRPKKATSGEEPKNA